MKTAPAKGAVQLVKEVAARQRAPKASFRKEVPQWAHWGGGLRFAKQNIRSKQRLGLFHTFCLRQNTILSQPAADSSFHCAAVGGFAALRMRRPPCGEKEPIPPSPAGQAFHPPGGRCPRRGRMRGRGGQAVLTVRGDNLAAPSSVTACGRATFPLEGGRLLVRSFSLCFLTY